VQSPRALVVDYGGVLTTSMADAMARGFAETGIDPVHFGALMREWMSDSTGHNPVHALERGEIGVAEIEHAIAGRLADLGAVRPDPGFVATLFRGFEALAGGMVGIVQRARAQGVRTALLSNSWGFEYDRTDWEELFDAVVISGEVGMRKPEPQIYRVVADRLGVDPTECVFVDDLRPNIRGAVAVGMIGVHHVDLDTTAGELAVLFGRDFRD
jgi:putative hydrolase of the HAD superfamily